MKLIEVEVLTKYTIEVDETSKIVQEYYEDIDLVLDLVNYNFSILPVIDNGVKVLDREVEHFKIIKNINL